MTVFTFLLELPVGHYQLQVEAKSFQTYIQEGITLNVTETAVVPVHLVVGSEAQKVQVTADAAVDSGHSDQPGQVVSGARDFRSTAQRRNFTQTRHVATGRGAVDTRVKEAGGSVRQGQSFAVNGQRPESNNFFD